MKISIVAFAVAALLGLAATPAARAQNYRPFGPGRTYHYREAAAVVGGADSFFTFRVDSAAASGANSVYYFNRTVRQNAMWGSPTANLRRINVFGGWMRWNGATGVAIFGAADTSATVELHTRAANGTSWRFTDSLTAAITAFRVTGFPTSDTILTITVSDGRRIEVSRWLGILESPAFDYYLGRTYAAARRPRRLELAAVPELQVGTMDTRWVAMCDLQPGDTLLYYQRVAMQGPLGPGQQSYSLRSWEAVAVQQRRQSLNGDTLRVDCHLTRSSLHYSDDQFLQLDSTSFVSGVNFQLLFIRPADDFLTGIGLSDPSRFGGFWTNSSSIGYQHLDSLANRPILLDPWVAIDVGGTRAYAAGLGEVLREEYVGGAGYRQSRRRLIGFVKNNGASRWGVTATPQPLAAPAALAARLPATLAPNPAPAGAAPTVSFTLDKPQGASLVLYDAVGRTVWQQTTAALEAGAQRLPIAAATSLTPGLYRLRLTLADGRQRLLSLVRE